MSSEYNLRQLIEGAILGAVWIVLLLMSIYTPLFIVAILLLPIPFTILTHRNGLRVALLTAATSTILTVIFNLFLPGFSLIIYSIIVGITTGYCFFKHKPAFVSFVFTAVAVLASNLLSIMILWFLTDYNLITDLTHTLEESFVAAEAFMKSVGVESTVDASAVESVVQMIRLLLPAILIGTSVISAYAYYQIMYFIMRKLNISVAKLPSLAEVRLPRKIIYYFIFSSITMMVLVLNNSTDGFFYMLLLNIVQILSLAFAVQGIGLLWYYMNNKKWSKFVRFPILLIFLHPVLLQIMTWVGMLDIFFNWRKLPN